MSVKRLMLKISVYTGIFTTSGCMYFFFKAQHGLRNSPYFTESMRLLQEHSGAVEYLGKPLKFGYVDLGTENNFCDGYKAQFEVRVKGSKNSGTLYFWARRENAQNKWDVYHLEFLPSRGSKRLIVRQQEEC